MISHLRREREAVATHCDESRRAGAAISYIIPLNKGLIYGSSKQSRRAPFEKTQHPGALSEPWLPLLTSRRPPARRAGVVIAAKTNAVTNKMSL